MKWLSVTLWYLALAVGGAGVGISLAGAQMAGDVLVAAMFGLVCLWALAHLWLDPETAA